MKAWAVAVLAISIGLSGGLAKAESLPPAEQTSINRASERGRQKYELDRAAWVSTDSMVAQLPKDRLAKVKGWIVENDGDTYTAIYYGNENNGPVAIFVADVRNGVTAKAKEIKADAPPVLTETEKRMIEARAAAMAEKLTPCAQAKFNTIVVPPTGADTPVEVYLLTPQVQTKALPFGGHFLVTVGADGKVTGSRPFTKSCIDLSLEGDKGRQPIGLMITHLLDPTPTEIHVFNALSSHLAVYVSTAPNRIWKVDGARISAVEPPKK
jgi:hypothetical protein